MNINFLKKILKYRLSYTGTKETDILYKKYTFEFRTEAIFLTNSFTVPFTYMRDPK